MEIKFQRNPSTGLVEGVDYKLNEEGLIDWRAMVRLEDLVPNREILKRKGLKDEDISKLKVAELDDSQRLILLGGLKRLARFRGYNYVKFTALRVESTYVSMICEIEYIGNFETSGVPIKFQSLANASVDNVGGDFSKYLETIAENRCFARCIRNFLGINICSKEEIISSEIIDQPSVTSFLESKIPITNSTDPKSMLKQKIADLNWSFHDFHSKIKDANKLNIEHNKKLDDNGVAGRRRTVIDNIENWKSLDDIPVSMIFMIAKKIDEYKINLLNSR